MITIKKGKSPYPTFGKECLFITFPYSPEVVQKIKTLPERKYEVATKTWQAPVQAIKNLLELFDKDELDIASDIDLDCKVSEFKYDVEFFSSTLNNIQDTAIRNFTEHALQQLPEYFWEVAASSTGKYHPKYALGKGGLIRHTKAALMIAEELFNNTLLFEFTEQEKDIARSAIHLHDGTKHGTEGSTYTISTHPLEVTQYLQDKVKTQLPVQVSTKIYQCIETHMGQWNTDYKTGEEILDVPVTKLQKFVHLCDYLASRKCLEVVFND